jgi:hypothetical protein
VVATDEFSKSGRLGLGLIAFEKKQQHDVVFKKTLKTL